MEEETSISNKKKSTTHHTAYPKRRFMQADFFVLGRDLFFFSILAARQICSCTPNKLKSMYFPRRRTVWEKKQNIQKEVAGIEVFFREHVHLNNIKWNTCYCCDEFPWVVMVIDLPMIHRSPQRCWLLKREILCEIPMSLFENRLGKSKEISRFKYSWSQWNILSSSDK